MRVQSLWQPGVMAKRQRDRSGIPTACDRARVPRRRSGETAAGSIWDPDGARLGDPKRRRVRGETAAGSIWDPDSTDGARVWRPLAKRRVAARNDWRLRRRGEMAAGSISDLDQLGLDRHTVQPMVKWQRDRSRISTPPTHRSRTAPPRVKWQRDRSRISTVGRGNDKRRLWTGEMAAGSISDLDASSTSSSVSE